MLRRTQLALALILLLVLAPLASSLCGIGCLPAAQPATMRPAQAAHSATIQQHCVRATSCCHPSGATRCNITTAPEAVALVSGVSASATADAAPFDVIPADLLPSATRNLIPRRIDSSPPGQLVALSLAPLRI
jgi:hypothetical protein